MLKRSVDLNKQLYDGLLQRLEDAGITSKMESTSAHVVDAAKPPTTRVRPQVAKNLLLGAVTGLTLGVMVAFGLEHFDGAFTNAADLESTLNVPVLGVVPAALLRAGGLIPGSLHPSATQRKGSPRRTPLNWFRLDRDGTDYFQLTEAIRNLRTSLLFAIDTTQPRSLLISSAVPAEGKTTISSNISIALAQLGKRVLLIDGDLRRPSVHRCFGVNNDSGLSDYLENGQDWLSLTVASGVPGLSLLTCGRIPGSPVELISTERMPDLIQQAQQEFDFVVVDSATLINVTDSRILASYVDAVILVVRSGSTSRKLVKQAHDNLRTVSAKVIGLVLNQLDRHDEQYSYSYYGEPTGNGTVRDHPKTHAAVS
jgi:polysaccharide biosynthesis transport protein